MLEVFAGSSDITIRYVRSTGLGVKKYSFY